jgi:hypothetical protein
MLLLLESCCGEDVPIRNEWNEGEVTGVTVYSELMSFSEV